MKFTSKKAGRMLSALLAAVMIVTSIPQAVLTAHATEIGDTVTDPHTIVTETESDVSPDEDEILGTDDTAAPEEAAPIDKETSEDASSIDAETSEETPSEDAEISEETLPVDTETPNESQSLGLLEDDDITLTQFRVSFELSGHGNPIEPLEVAEGSTLSDSEDLQPTAKGFRFDGWYKDETLKQKWNFDTDTMTANITLYAKWTALFTVTFELSGHGDAIEPLEVDEGSKLIDSEDLQPTAEGLRFGGWYKNADFTEIWDFNTDTVTNNITLYARWTVTVTFELSGHGDEIEALTVDADSKLDNTSVPQPTANGYNFEGWYKDKDCTEQWNFNKDKVTQDITLYAKWQEVEEGTFIVTFNLSGLGNDFFLYPVADSTIAKPDDPQPAVEGYRFLGWYKESNYVTEWNFDEDTVTENITLYAKWEELTYTVTYDFSGKGENITISDIKFGSLLTQTEELTPTAEGYLFLGWYKDADFTQKWDFTRDTVTDNITLYAKWQEIEENKYMVTYNLSEHGDDIYVYVDQGSKLTRPDDPTDEGWLFINWYTDEEYQEAWDFEYDTVDSDLTLYAKWVQPTSLQVGAISPIPYTGKAITPAVSVYYSVYNEDGDETQTTLKVNKDYKVSYKNNINTNAYVLNGESSEDGDTPTGGSNSTGALGVGGFNPSLPHVIIEGKGNYSGKLYMNFEITQVSISDEEGNIAAGFTLKCNDQFPLGKPKADQKTITSLKYKVAMTEGKDYTAEITGAESTGSVISKDDPIFDKDGNGGDCTLTIMGIGNYTGTFTRPIIVRDKNTLLKNATISLGSKCKSKPLDEEGVTLIPAWYEEVEEEQYDKNGDPIEDADGNIKVKKKTVYKQYIDGDWVDCLWIYDEKKDDEVRRSLDKNNAFTVKIGSKWLQYGEDYDISYANNTSVGTATMTIKGTGEYTGSKSVNFKITKASGSGGKAFSASTITFMSGEDGGGWVSKITYDGTPKIQSVTLRTKKSTTIYDCGMENGDEEEYEVPYKYKDEDGEWVEDTKIKTRKHKHSKKNCEWHEEIEKVFAEDEYTVTYKNNILVGTATVIFTANPGSGYSGSFKKTFKITPINVAEFVTFVGDDETLEPDVYDYDVWVDTGKKDEDDEPIMKEKHIHKVNATRYMQETTIPYVKSGATLNFNLTSEISEEPLVLNRDYTISYKSHTKVTPLKKTKVYEEEEDDDGKTTNVWTGDYEFVADKSKMGTLVIKGKGNYSGTVNIKYQIVQGTMDTDNAKVTVARSAYDPKTKEYKPKVTVWTPNAGNLSSDEFSVKYDNNKKDAVTEYLNNGGDAPAPTVTVTFKKNGSYENLCDKKDADGNVEKYEPITLDPVTMEFYPNKLTAKNLYIIIDNENPKELVYTGKQVTNVRARVYYGTDAAVKAAKKAKVTNHKLLTDEKGSYKLIRLTEAVADEEGNYSDGAYTVTYGKNIAVGKNKGSITINGCGAYGGSVSQKFTIYQNPVYYHVVTVE